MEVVCPSIHPSSSHKPRSRRKNPDILLPSDTLQLLLGDPKAGQTGYISPPATSGSAPGSPLKGWRPGRILTRCPNHLSWLLSMRRSSGSTRAPHPISKTERSYPQKETYFRRLYLRSRIFCHYSDLMTIGDSWDKDGAVNWKFLLLAQLPLHHKGPAQRSQYCWRSPNPSVRLSLQLAREQHPEILKLLRLRQRLIPDPKRALHLFLLENNGLIWRSWLLHTQLWSSPAHTEGHGLRRPTETHHLHKAQVPKPDAALSLTMTQDLIRENHKQGPDEGHEGRLCIPNAVN